jgi:hypothetical protein
MKVTLWIPSVFFSLPLVFNFVLGKKSVSLFPGKQILVFNRMGQEE